MGVGPRTNLYSIGGDSLTQLILFNYFLWWPNDPITFFTNIFITCKSHNTAKLMQLIEHSSLSKALVYYNNYYVLYTLL